MQKKSIRERERERESKSTKLYNINIYIYIHDQLGLKEHRKQLLIAANPRDSFLDPSHSAITLADVAQTFKETTIHCKEGDQSVEEKTKIVNRSARAIICIFGLFLSAPHQALLFSFYFIVGLFEIDYVKAMEFPEAAATRDSMARMVTAVAAIKKGKGQQVGKARTRRSQSQVKRGIATLLLFIACWQWGNDGRPGCAGLYERFRATHEGWQDTNPRCSPAVSPGPGERGPEDPAEVVEPHACGQAKDSRKGESIGKGRMPMEEMAGGGSTDCGDPEAATRRDAREVEEGAATATRRGSHSASNEAYRDDGGLRRRDPATWGRGHAGQCSFAKPKTPVDPKPVVAEEDVQQQMQQKLQEMQEQLQADFQHRLQAAQAAMEQRYVLQMQKITPVAGWTAIKSPEIINLLDEGKGQENPDEEKKGGDPQYGADRPRTKTEVSPYRKESTAKTRSMEDRLRSTHGSGPPENG